MPRKVLDVRKECVRLSCQRQTKSPSGLSVGGLFAYRHAPERLRSRTPWNKSSAYVLNTHYKSEIFKPVILSVLYHIRHFDVFVVKRKTLTFVKVYHLWCIVDSVQDQKSLLNVQGCYIRNSPAFLFRNLPKKSHSKD